MAEHDDAAERQLACSTTLRDNDTAAPQQSTHTTEGGECDTENDTNSISTAESRTDKATRRLSTTGAAVTLGTVAVLALAAVVGWLGYRSYENRQSQTQRELFVATARAGALNLTTIDHTHVDADVQRILDSATGTFRDDFQKRSGPFVEVVKQTQSRSTGAVVESGLEVHGQDTAQVLVAVSVMTTNMTAPQQEPRSWRMRISVQKDGGDAKISDVEFVP